MSPEPAAPSWIGSTYPVLPWAHCPGRAPTSPAAPASPGAHYRGRASSNSLPVMVTWVWFSEYHVKECALLHSGDGSPTGAGRPSWPTLRSLGLGKYLSAAFSGQPACPSPASRTRSPLVPRPARTPLSENDLFPLGASWVVAGDLRLLDYSLILYSSVSRRVIAGLVGPI